jgi:hypothetical protein
MKFSIIFVLPLIVISFLSSGCKKDATENTKPHVYSGDDQNIFLPEDSAILKGVAFDMQNNIRTTIWKKLVGPSLYSFYDSTSLITAVNSLRPGKYMFQLTAIDKMGLVDNDTTFITVFQPGGPGTNEIIFENIEWNCPMGCFAFVNNIYGHTQFTTIKEVFMRSNDSSAWQSVSRWDDGTGAKTYSYYIEYNSLSIYTEDISGSVDIKVIY